MYTHCRRRVDNVSQAAARPSSTLVNYAEMGGKRQVTPEELAACVERRSKYLSSRIFPYYFPQFPLFWIWNQQRTHRPHFYRKKYQEFNNYLSLILFTIKVRAVLLLWWVYRHIGGVWLRHTWRACAATTGRIRRDWHMLSVDLWTPYRAIVHCRPTRGRVQIFTNTDVNRCTTGVRLGPDFVHRVRRTSQSFDCQSWSFTSSVRRRCSDLHQDFGKCHWQSSGVRR